LQAALVEDPSGEVMHEFAGQSKQALAKFWGFAILSKYLLAGQTQQVATRFWFSAALQSQQACMA